MATVIRAQISEKSKYFIEKHRYYELKHFCLQYNDWKKGYGEIDGYNEVFTDDPTYECASKRIAYFNKMQMIEQAAIKASPELASYILEAVTNDLPYTILRTKYDIPCGRDLYYMCYRRFYWLLDKTRN